MQTAKLFVNGSSQAVRLPKEFRFEGNEVYAYKIGDTVMLVSKEKAWSTFLEGINEFTDDYLDIAERRDMNNEFQERESL